jgi:hypothetical protein
MTLRCKKWMDVLDKIISGSYQRTFSMELITLFRQIALMMGYGYLSGLNAVLIVIMRTA